MRLVDADELDVEDIPSYYGSSCYAEDVEKWIAEAPTVEDKVETRCNDCKNWNSHPINGKVLLGKCSAFNCVTRCHEFCSRAKRR